MGAITTYFNDKPAWAAVAGAYTKIDFVGTGMPFEEVAFDHYSSIGITIGSVQLPNGCNWSLQQNAGQGSDGWIAFTASGFALDPYVINFAAPQHAFAHDEFAFFGEPVCVDFFLSGQLMGSSCLSPPFGQQGINFFGWTTDFAFDRVVMNNDDGIDNMYIVPAPGTATVFFALSRSRRRRS